MNQKTIFSIALGAATLSSATMAIHTPGQTLSGNRSFQLAQTLSTSEIEQSVYEQINRYRASKGKPALTRNSSMDIQSRIHSQNMANGSVPFGHQGFSDRVRNTGIPYSTAGENVAYNCGYGDPAQKAVQGWLNSPGHRANIEGDYNLTGIGVAATSNGRCFYFTQLFIKSR